MIEARARLSLPPPPLTGIAVVACLQSHSESLRLHRNPAVEAVSEEFGVNAALRTPAFQLNRRCHRSLPFLPRNSPP